MFLRALTAVAAVGLLTTIATGPAFSGKVGTVKPIGGNFTLTHHAPDRRVQGQIGKPKYDDMKSKTGVAGSDKDHKNWVTIETMNKGSTKPGGGATADR